MFTREEFLEKLDHLLSLPSVPIIYIGWDQDKFTTPSSEELIEIFRGKRSLYEGAMHFWVTCLRYQEDANPDTRPSGYARLSAPEHSLCRPISEDEFSAKVSEKLSHLQEPVPLRLSSLFLGAMQMSEDWNDESFLCATDEEYIGFFWDTTA